MDHRNNALNLGPGHPQPGCDQNMGGEETRDRRRFDLRSNPGRTPSWLQILAFCILGSF